jgi:hypothetical protein
MATTQAPAPAPAQAPEEQEKNIWNLYGVFKSTPVTKESELAALTKKCEVEKAAIEAKYSQQTAPAAGGGRRRKTAKRKSPSKKRARKSMYNKISKWNPFK